MHFLFRSANLQAIVVEQQREGSYSMSLAKIVATTTINGLQESKREGWARQNDMANNIEYFELMKEKEEP